MNPVPTFEVISIKPEPDKPAKLSKNKRKRIARRPPAAVPQPFGPSASFLDGVPGSVLSVNGKLLKNSGLSKDFFNLFGRIAKDYRYSGYIPIFENVGIFLQDRLKSLEEELDSTFYELIKPAFCEVQKSAHQYYLVAYLHLLSIYFNKRSEMVSDLLKVENYFPNREEIKKNLTEEVMKQFLDCLDGKYRSSYLSSTPTPNLRLFKEKKFSEYKNYITEMMKDVERCINCVEELFTIDPQKVVRLTDNPVDFYFTGNWANHFASDNNDELKILDLYDLLVVDVFKLGHDIGLVSRVTLKLQLSLFKELRNLRQLPPDDIVVNVDAVSRWFKKRDESKENLQDTKSYIEIILRQATDNCLTHKQYVTQAGGRLERYKDKSEFCAMLLSSFEQTMILNEYFNYSFSVLGAHWANRFSQKNEQKNNLLDMVFYCAHVLKILQPFSQPDRETKKKSIIDEVMSKKGLNQEFLQSVADYMETINEMDSLLVECVNQEFIDLFDTKVIKTHQLLFEDLIVFLQGFEKYKDKLAAIEKKLEEQKSRMQQLVDRLERNQRDTAKKLGHGLSRHLKNRNILLASYTLFKSLPKVVGDKKTPDLVVGEEEEVFLILQKQFAAYSRLFDVPDLPEAPEAPAPEPVHEEEPISFLPIEKAPILAEKKEENANPKIDLSDFHPNMKFRDFKKRLAKMGWKGVSFGRHLKVAKNGYSLPVPVRSSQLATGTQAAILRQIREKEEQMAAK